MVTNNTDTDELITKALCEDGLLFQIKCLRSIENMKLFVLLAEEYPVGINEETTRIDFVFSRSDYETSYLIFECKKANPDYKTWVFLVEKNKKPDSYASVYTDNLESITLDRINSAIKKQSIGLNKKSWQFLSIYKSKYAVEIVTNFKKYDKELQKANAGGKKPKSYTRETIEDASFQLIKAMHGFVKESIYIDGNKSKPDLKRFIPILITNAELMVCKYDPELIGKDGNVPHENLNYKPENYIFYDYGRDEKIRLEEDNSEGDNSFSKRAEFKRRPFFIVNVNYLPEFLNIIAGLPPEYNKEQQ